MVTPRYFVSLDDQGRPLCQRTSVRARPFVAASYEGDRFSSVGPNGAYPRKVVEVQKPLEWVARATFPDGEKVVERSKAGPVGRNCIRYTFLRNHYSVANGHEASRSTVQECWSSETAAEFVARSAQHMEYQVESFAAGESLEIRNWPTAGDSIVLPDPVQK